MDIYFRSVDQAFNHYKEKSLEELESRAKEIKDLIEKDENVEIESLNKEARGIEEAKKNLLEKRTKKSKGDGSVNFITGTKKTNTELPDNEKIFGTEEYRSAFYNTLLDRELSEVEERAMETAQNIVQRENRAGEFTTATNTPVVLPTTTLDEIIKKADVEGGLLQHARDFNIPTGLSIPVATPTGAAKWHEEGEEVDSEKPNIVEVEFDGYEIIKILSISAKVKHMSISAFESFLADELHKQVMNTIEYALVNGTGEKQGLGVMTGVEWTKDNTVEAKGKFEYTDFTEVMAKLKRGYGSNAKFAMNEATLYRQVYGVVDMNKRPIFTPDPRNELVGHILGKPIVIDDNLEDDVVLYGNFDYLGYNLPLGVMVEVSRESSFRKGLIDYRAMAIADCKPIVDEAFIKLEIAAATK